MTLSQTSGAHRQPNYLATVVSKSGTTVTVRRLNDPAAAPTLGPFPTELGVSGLVEVGDTVTVDQSTGTELVRMPAERATRSALSIIAQDLEVRETASHTAWVELLNSGAISIPPGVPFTIEWHSEVLVTGQAGATAKQNQLVFNGALAVPVNLQSAAGDFWLPWQMSVYSTGFTVEQRKLILLTDLSLVTGFTLDEITEIRVDGRTNDTGEGNDIVRAGNLLVRV